MHSKCILLFLTTFGIASGNDTCKSGSPNKRSCTRTAVVVVDETIDMRTQEFVEDEIDFIEDYVISSLNIEDDAVSVGFIRYGSKLELFEDSSNREVVCNNLEDIRNTANINRAGNVTVTKAVIFFCNNFLSDSTTLVLFTGSTMQSDIDDAGAYLTDQIKSNDIKDFYATIINYGNTTFDDKYWPKEYTQIFTKSDYSDADLSDEIGDSICEFSDSSARTTATTEHSPHSTTSRQSGDICIRGDREWMQSCTRHVVIAIDETVHMSRIDDIQNEIDFVYHLIVPKLDVAYAYVSVAFLVYGSNSQIIYDTSSLRDVVCGNVLDIAKNMPKTNAEQNNQTLERTMDQLCNNFELDHTTLVLFSSTENQEDVDSAGSYLSGRIKRDDIRGFNAVVVNYRSTTFESWPSTVAYSWNEYAYDSFIAEVIREGICGISTTKMNSRM